MFSIYKNKIIKYTNQYFWGCFNITFVITVIFYIISFFSLLPNDFYSADGKKDLISLLLITIAVTLFLVALFIYCLKIMRRSFYVNGKMFEKVDLQITVYDGKCRYTNLTSNIAIEFYVKDIKNIKTMKEAFIIKLQDNKSMFFILRTLETELILKELTRNK